MGVRDLAAPRHRSHLAPRALVRLARRDTSRDLVALLLLLAVALWQNLSDVPLTPFHPDETRWLNRAHYIRDLADPFGPTWDDGYLTRGQPPLGSYLVGLGLLLQGRDLQTNGVWDFSQDEAWNVARGNMSDPADLTAGRRTNAVVGALTVLVLYLLVARLANRAGAVAAALFLALHPLMIALSSQVLSDALTALLIALAALSATFLADRPSWPRALLLGLLLGLAAATKLSPFLVACGLAGIGALLLAHDRWRGRDAPETAGRNSRLGLMLLALPLIAYAIFVAVYPYLWPDPIGRTGHLLAFRVDEMADQGRRWPEVAVTDRFDALRRVGETLGVDYSTSGRLVRKAAARIDRDWRVRGVDLVLALAGGIILLGRIARRGWTGREALAGLVLGGQSAVIVATMRADYPRYHLPILLAVAAGIGILAGVLWTWLAERRLA